MSFIDWYRQHLYLVMLNHSTNPGRRLTSSDYGSGPPKIIYTNWRSGGLSQPRANALTRQFYAHVEAAWPARRFLFLGSRGRGEHSFERFFPTTLFFPCDPQFLFLW